MTTTNLMTFEEFKKKFSEMTNDIIHSKNDISESYPKFLTENRDNFVKLFDDFSIVKEMFAAIKKDSVSDKANNIKAILYGICGTRIDCEVGAENRKAMREKIIKKLPDARLRNFLTEDKKNQDIKDLYLENYLGKKNFNLIFEGKSVKELKDITPKELNSIISYHNEFMMGVDDPILNEVLENLDLKKANTIPKKIELIETLTSIKTSNSKEGKNSAVKIFVSKIINQMIQTFDTQHLEENKAKLTEIKTLAKKNGLTYVHDMIGSKLSSYKKFENMKSDDFLKNPAMSLNLLFDLGTFKATEEVQPLLDAMTLEDLYNAIYNNSYISHANVFEKNIYNQDLNIIVLNSLFDKINVSIKDNTERDLKSSEKMFNMVLSDLLSRKVEGESIFGNLEREDQKSVMKQVSSLLKSEKIHIKADSLIKLYKETCGIETSIQKIILESLEKDKSVDFSKIKSELLTYSMENGYSILLSMEAKEFKYIDKSEHLEAFKNINFDKVDIRKLTPEILFDNIKNLGGKFKQGLFETKHIDKILGKYMPDMVELAQGPKFGKVFNEEAQKMLFNHILANHNYNAHRKDVKVILDKIVGKDEELLLLNEFAYGNNKFTKEFFTMLNEKKINLGDPEKFLDLLSKYMLQNGKQKLIPDERMFKLLNTYLDCIDKDTVKTSYFSKLIKALKECHPKLTSLHNRIDVYFVGKSQKHFANMYDLNKMLKKDLDKFTPELIHKELDAYIANRHIPEYNIIKHCQHIIKDPSKDNKDKIKMLGGILTGVPAIDKKSRVKDFIAKVPLLTKILELVEKFCKAIPGLRTLYDYFTKTPDVTILDKNFIKSLAGLGEPGKLLADTIELYDQFAELVKNNEVEPAQVAVNNKIVNNMLDKLDKLVLLKDQTGLALKLTENIVKIMSKKDAVDLGQVSEKFSTTYNLLLKSDKIINAQKTKDTQQENEKKELLESFKKAKEPLDEAFKQISEKITKAKDVKEADVQANKKLIKKAYSILGNVTTKPAKDNPMEALMAHKETIGQLYCKVMLKELENVTELTEAVKTQKDGAEDKKMDPDNAKKLMDLKGNIELANGISSKSKELSDKLKELKGNNSLNEYFKEANNIVNPEQQSADKSRA